MLQAQRCCTPVTLTQHTHGSFDVLSDGSCGCREQQQRMILKKMSWSFLTMKRQVQAGLAAMQNLLQLLSVTVMKLRANQLHDVVPHFFESAILHEP